MNIQTIPRRDKVIKRCFVPKLDYLLFIDYQQIELRMLSYYLAQCGYPEMTEVFKQGKDLHAESARGALGLTHEPTEEQRQVGKTLNFSLVYGGGAATIMRQLELEFFEAYKILQAFHNTWPGIGWQTRTKKAPPYTLLGKIGAQLEKNGYIKTPWGRLLHPESEHKQLNVLVQGSSADLLRTAIVKCHAHLRSEGLESHLINAVHDELIFDVAASELEELVQNLPGLMDHPPISEVVPVEVDIEISATSWADKESYDAFSHRLDSVGRADTTHSYEAVSTAAASGEAD